MELSHFNICQKYFNWIFFTESSFFAVLVIWKYLGAVESVKKFKCTAKQALDCKEFSAGYWQWDHLFLVDAVKQFDWPSAFVTLSPCEWTFLQVCKHFGWMLSIFCSYFFRRNFILGGFVLISHMLILSYKHYACSML